MNKEVTKKGIVIKGTNNEVLEAIGELVFQFGPYTTLAEVLDALN